MTLGFHLWEEAFGSLCLAPSSGDRGKVGPFFIYLFIHFLLFCPSVSKAEVGDVSGVCHLLIV